MVRIPSGMWIATGYQEVAEVARCPFFRVNADAYKGDLAENSGMPGSHERLATMDPPAHTRLRRCIAPLFDPRRLEADMAEVSHRTLDRVFANDRLDVMVDYAYPVTIEVLSRFLGVPEGDADRVLSWAQITSRGLDRRSKPAVQQRVMTADAEATAYFAELVARKSNSLSADFISSLIGAQASGLITIGELLGTCTLLMVAGLVTIASLIGNSVYNLLLNPNQIELLRSVPSALVTGIDELLRHESPVQVGIGRVAERHVEIHGFEIEQGDTVAMAFGIANRDPDVFESPEVIDLERPNARDHIAFGGGIHRCLGAALARMESRIAIGAFFERATTAQLIGKPTRMRSVTLRGFENLPVAVTAT